MSDNEDYNADYNASFASIRNQHRTTPNIPISEDYENGYDFDYGVDYGYEYEYEFENEQNLNARKRASTLDHSRTRASTSDGAPISNTTGTFVLDSFVPPPSHLLGSRGRNWTTNSFPALMSNASSSTESMTAGRIFTSRLQAIKSLSLSPRKKSASHGPKGTEMVPANNSDNDAAMGSALSGSGAAPPSRRSTGKNVVPDVSSLDQSQNSDDHPSPPQHLRRSNRERPIQYQEEQPVIRDTVDYGYEQYDVDTNNDKIHGVDDSSEEKEEDELSLSQADEENQQQNEPSILGHKLPQWLRKLRPNYTGWATCIVARAPCFWCFSFHSKTDRNVLIRLNFLCAFFCCFTMASSLWLLICLLAPNITERNSVEWQGEEGRGGIYLNEPQKQGFFEVTMNVWNSNAMIFLLGFLAVIILFATLVTVPIIRNVDLLGAIRYLWLLVWITPYQVGKRLRQTPRMPVIFRLICTMPNLLYLFFLSWPFQILGVIGCFDYFRVTKIWIEHWWIDGSMAWFRNYFCEASTANNRCAAPHVPNVTSWCLDMFNSTDCEGIQSNAQNKMEAFMLSFYYINAIWGFLVVILVGVVLVFWFLLNSWFEGSDISNNLISFPFQLVLVIHTLENVITKPLVQKSRESNVPFWFSLPIIGCLAMGLVYAYSSTSVLSLRSGTSEQALWIGPLYIATAGTLRTIMCNVVPSF